MTIIQLVLVAIAALGFAAAVSRFRRGVLSFRQLLLWSVLWLAVAGVVLRPELASAVARRLGVGRGADVVTYLSLAVIFYLLFRMFGRLEDQERQITKLTREVALKDLEKDGS